ncbi:MAG TPA: hypothetical protein VJ787_10425, partial [Thermoleophilia bacterium]|nr:hypothetical protein [Thermoleophilia bacterium]
VDRAGDVVVVGRSKAASTKAGIVIIKYKPGGAEAWAAPVRFDAEPADPNAGWVYAVSLALDAAGDVYVAGGSTHRVSGAWIESALTLKFDAATGAKEWGQLYDAQHGVQSYAQDIVVRGGRVVIVGSTWGMTFGADENGLLVRYEAASGAQKYWKEWGADNPMGEWFGDVVLDGSGYVYVTGDQRRGGTGSFDRAVTLKLTPSLSKVVWKATFLPATRSAAGWYIVRDRQGNVYVSGVKHDARANDDFVTIKYGPGGGQKWVRVWSGGGPDNDEPHGLVLGTTGGVHAGGQTTVKDGTERAILLKYQR